MSSVRNGRTRLSQVVLLSILFLGGLLCVLPFIWSLLTSLMPKLQVYQFPPQMIPDPFTFDSYVKAWTTQPFARFYFNSFGVAGAVVLGQVLTSTAAAYAFARLKFWGKETIFVAYLGTLMVPFQILVIPLFLIMRTLGWVDSYAALIVPLIGTPFGVFLIRQYYTTIPMSLDEAAEIDGATELQIYSRIILPLSKPAIAVLSVLTFINTWNSFIWPLIVINSTEKRTLPLAVAAFQNQYYTDWTLLMAAVILTTIPVVIIYLLAQKHLERGVAMTGLKY